MPQTPQRTDTNTVALTANGRTEWFTEKHADAVLALKDTQWKKVEAEGKGKAAPAPVEADKPGK